MSRKKKRERTRKEGEEDNEAREGKFSRRGNRRVASNGGMRKAEQEEMRRDNAEGRGRRKVMWRKREGREKDGEQGNAREREKD